MEFTDLPSEGRVWVFGSERPLAPEEGEEIVGSMRTFLSRWAAHGRALRASATLALGRFLVVGIDQATSAPSGCSIDDLFRQVKELERRTGSRLTDRATVWFRGGDGEIQGVSRPAFAELAAQGEVGPDTPVFDLTITSVGELRSGALERPARESWHGRAFFSEAAASPRED